MTQLDQVSDVVLEFQHILRKLDGRPCYSDMSSVYSKYLEGDDKISDLSSLVVRRAFESACEEGNITLAKIIYQNASKHRSFLDETACKYVREAKEDAERKISEIGDAWKTIPKEMHMPKELKPYYRGFERYKFYSPRWLCMAIGGKTQQFSDDDLNVLNKKRDFPFGNEFKTLSGIWIERNKEDQTPKVDPDELAFFHRVYPSAPEWATNAVMLSRTTIDGKMVNDWATYGIY